MESDYHRARTRIADALDAAAAAQRRSELREIERYFASVDSRENRGDGRAFEKIAIALSFFDGWADASNHDWRYYAGLSAEDWPRLARSISDALRADVEIADPAILSRFGPQKDRGD